MNGPRNLHPDDYAIRINLRNMLTERRIDLGLTQTEAGQRCNLTKACVGNLERADSWRLINIQRLAYGLGWRLVLEPDGLPVDPHADSTLFRPTDPERAHLWDQKNLVTALTYARIRLGLTQAAVGERLGVGMRAVGKVEAGANLLMFATAQQYARALGGSLFVGVEDLQPALAGAA